MAQNGIPLFAHLEANQNLTGSNCGPHLTFTTDCFFNPPHIDKKDVSEFAFVIFLPNKTEDGSLITNPANYNITSGPFIFPDQQFGINFDH